MLVDFNFPIHSAIFHRVVSPILVCSLQLTERYIGGVSEAEASHMAGTEAEDPN